MKEIEKLNQMIEIKNIQIRKCVSKTEELFHKGVIYKLQKNLRVKVASYTKKFQSTNIYRAMSNEKISFYN